METLIWMFLAAALLVTGIVVGVKKQSVWHGAVWVVMAVALVAVVRQSLW